MIDPRRIIDFLTKHDCRITVKDYGKKRDYRPQMMLTLDGASIPLDSGATEPLIKAVVAIMTSRGLQVTFHKSGQ
jgi:hypothetical protein